MSGLGGQELGIQKRFIEKNRRKPSLVEALELRVEELELELSESKTNEAILEVEVRLKARVIRQLEAELHGSRQHVTEVNQDV